MSRLKGKVSEVLDACLSSESPEVRAKVYEIINLSGLQVDDPMFLVLTLTGQMRVFLEAAPAELSKLLREWKERNARSLEEIQRTIAVVKETQRLQADSMRQNLEGVSQRCVFDIQEAGMAATSAIAEANSETLAQALQVCHQASELKEEVMALHTKVEADRQANEDILKVLLQGIGQTIKGLEKAVVEINYSGAAIRRLQQDTFWIKWAEWFSPLWALLVVGVIGLGSGWWLMSLKYNDSTNLLGRRLVNWNIDRILKCQKDNNPKCTIWIVSPERRK